MSQPLFLSTILTPVFASLRQPLSGAHRPLALLGSGVTAASTFFESLADADDAALKRPAIVCILPSFIFSHPVVQENAPFLGSCHQILLHIQENTPFLGSWHHFAVRIHKNASFRGQRCLFDVRVHPNACFCGQNVFHASCFRWVASVHDKIKQISPHQNSRRVAFSL